MRIVFVCLGVLFGFAGSAYSLPVTFDFSSKPDPYQEVSALNFSINGLGVEVGARSVDHTSATITWSDGDGLGVRADSETVQTIDGATGDDVLLFKFSADVMLKIVEFSCVEYYDSFKLLEEDFSRKIDPTSPGGSTVSYDFSSQNFNGSSFSLMAEGYKDSFRIKSITVVTPIPAPEPSTWLLLGAGLTAFVFWRKKFKD